MSSRRRRGESGQTLVIFAGGMIGLLAMVALVVDGSNAYAQHRAAQNAADAASQAGAAVLARAMLTGDPPVDFDVKHAINEMADRNDVRPFYPHVTGSSEAYYTDLDGNMLTPSGSTTTNPASAARVGSGTVAACGSSTACIDGRAVGVRAIAVRPFDALIAGAVGQTEFTARTVATAVVGYVPPPCDSDTGCPLLPITVATNLATCDAAGDPVFDSAAWFANPLEGPEPGNEVQLTVCATDQKGAFEWLDYDCAGIVGQIKTPCNQDTPFPSWLKGKTDEPTGVDDDLNKYAGAVEGTYEPDGDQIVLIPAYDAICHQDRPDDQDPAPGGAFPQECTGFDPSVTKRFYHSTAFVAFILDRAYVEDALGACDRTPGQPQPGGPSGGCLKGWLTGVVLPPGPVGADQVSGLPPRPLRIQLIK